MNSSQYINPELLTGNSKQQQQAHQLDLFSSFNNAELEAILAPHPDLFESELDSSLAGFDPIHFVTLDSDYGFVRDTNAISCGPPSTITVSSESAYDSVGGQPESLYNYTETNYSLPLDFDMDFNRGLDFQRVGLSATHDYSKLAAKQPTATGSLYHDSASTSEYEYSPPSTFDDPSSFGTLPSASPNLPSRNGSVYSDYSAGYQKRSMEIQNPSMFFNPRLPPSLTRQSHSRVQTPSVSASRISGHATNGSSHSRSASAVIDTSDNEPSDPRRKYTCSNCGRSFARQYNLKTHLETHDTNRKKPFVCSHNDCGRSFSRKHDLGRHLVSIHHEEKSSIGVGAIESRKRCDTCGASWVKGRKCDCEE